MSWKHFKIEEFKCKCGCGIVNIDHTLIDHLDEARELANLPFVVTSGYRCPTHNRNIGGSPTSSHMKGLAADIACRDTSTRYLMVKALLRARVPRIEIAPSWLHIDVDRDKKHPSMFLPGE